MAQVSLQINGFGYILGCADGEEDHLRALAADLDQRVDEIKRQVGQIGETRLLLMAALMLSDELHDLRKDDTGVEPAAKAPEKAEPKTSRRLRGLAKRAEALADAAETVPAPRAEQPTLLTPAAEDVAAGPEQP